jgi:hypothetical protein
VLRQALADGRAQPDPATPDSFSLADQATVKAVLAAAGFNKVTITDVREPIYYGPDEDAACNATFRPANDEGAGRKAGRHANPACTPTITRQPHRPRHR